MSRYKLIIEFMGTNYFGWQIQKESSKTVQGTLESALEKVFKMRLKTVGSGRTDAKVHSLDHHVVFEAPFDIPFQNLKAALNSHLPNNIRVKDVEGASTELNITRDAKSREYRYLFTNNAEANAFQPDLMANVSYELDFPEMKNALKCFIGTHDFADFHTLGSNPNTTMRTIFEAELFEVKTNTHGIFPDHYCIRIVGNGFLKQMVRLIVSSVWKVGRGKLTCAEIEASLKTPTGKHLAPVATGVGLYKYRTKY